MTDDCLMFSKWLFQFSVQIPVERCDCGYGTNRSILVFSSSGSAIMLISGSNMLAVVIFKCGISSSRQNLTATSC